MVVKKISVSLTDELNTKIQNAVDTGDYKSSSEVVRDALREWHKRREREALDDAFVRAAIDQGLASGDAVPVTSKMFDDLIQLTKSTTSKSRKASNSDKSVAS